MGREEVHVTDAELAILEVLWDRGSSTIREVTDALYPSGKNSELATVQKLLHRLEDKGYVQRDRSSFAHVVRAAVTRASLIGLQLQAVAKKFSGGSLAPLLVQLVESEDLSARDRSKLRKLLDDS